MATSVPGAVWAEPIDNSGSPGVARFTRARVERVMAVSVAIGFVALAVQAFIVAIAAPDVRPEWSLALMVLVFVPLVLMVVSFFVGWATRTCGIAFVVAYLIALLLWPAATAGSASPIGYQPWIYVLVNVATVAAVIVLPMPIHLAVTIVTPLLYGVVRLTELGFARDAWIMVALDSVYTLILGSVLLALAWTFRTASSVIDEQRVRAVSSYAQAAAVNATERERVAVAALMHDSVLAALLAAERADTPRGRDLAVSMAREALTRLANTDRDAGEGSDEPVAPEWIVGEVRQALEELGADAPVAADLDERTPPVPGRVARALVLATTQAISNAVEHAAGEGLLVQITGRPAPLGIAITVCDSGPGFDIDAVPADRLGIRASIVARMSAFGGDTVLKSDENGTRVSMTWRSGDA